MDARVHRTIDRARRLGRDIERFRTRTPQISGPQTDLPPFTWEQLQRQLTDLSDSPARARLATELVATTRGQAACKPPEMVLGEILLLAAAVLEETSSLEECAAEADQIT